LVLAIVGWGVFGRAVRLRADTLWAPVAADPYRTALEGIAIPASPGPEVVRLVGSPTREGPAPPKPVWRMSDREWAAPAAESAAGAVAAHGRESEIAAPADAIRLDSSDRVYGEASPAGGVQPLGTPRNPWEVRWAVRPKATRFLLACGGILVGGDGGPVAWVNGRVVRRGDRLGPFRVGGVQREAVLLELRGARYLLPRGRTATIALMAP
jgi:hypothetical protein